MESGGNGLGRTFVPTLGLVGSDGKVKTSTPEAPEKGPRLVAVSSTGNETNATQGSTSERIEDASPPQMNSTAMEFTSSEIEEVIKRPRLTLLILKEPTEKSDYVVAKNDPESEPELFYDDEHIRKKKKKKKHKSKEKCLTMSRSYAQKLVEIQKSMLKLTSKYQPDPVEFEIDRRRRTQSTCNVSHNDPLRSLKSPPPSAPVTVHVPSYLSGLKGKSSMYRRRYLSTSSNADTKRRFTRKKKSDVEETTQTPVSETAKKNHLSENNVWTPMDDYRLLVNIIQTKGNLEHVFAGTKFSCFYSFDEVAHRWETLLYDDKAGVLSQTAINNLHPVIRARIQTEALYSDDEENLLRSVKAVPGGNPELSSFMKILEENPHIFQHRTPRKLLTHWLEMKTFHLLDGQDVRDYKDPFSLFDLQDSAYLTALPDMAVYQELRSESKLVKHQIRQLEEEIESWHCMQELVVSDGTSDLQSIFSTTEFDDQTYAVLRGKQVRYCMRSKEILLGRHSTNNKVDADLTLEGASGKVSRRQAVIQMRGFGEFYIINQGRPSIFVDNTHVPYGGMTKLTDGCVIQITHIKLIFKVNEKLMHNEVKHEIKKEVINARIKSFDPHNSANSYPSSLRPPSALGSEGISSTKYTSPRKRNSSSASTSNSPVLGTSASNPFTVRQSGSRTMGPSAMGLGNGGSQLMPFSSGDLTIRPTSQPLTPSPFLTDSTSKHHSKSFLAGTTSSDGDVFKKPAPVSGVRPGSSKLTSSRMLNFSSPSPSSPVTGPSAFAAVGQTSLLAGSNVYNASPISNEHANDLLHSLGSTVSALSPTSQYMDYTKLGLSADVTVTQRGSLPVPSSSHRDSSPNLTPLTPVSAIAPSPTSTIGNSYSDIPILSMPSLGLVKQEDPNS